MAADLSEPWQLMLASCIASAGVGIAYSAMPTLIMDNSPAAEAGAGVGVNALMRSMGTTMTGAVMAIVLTSVTTSLPGTAIPSLTAYKLCFLLGPLAALGAVTIHAPLPNQPAAGSDGGPVTAGCTRSPGPESVPATS